MNTESSLTGPTAPSVEELQQRFASYRLEELIANSPSGAIYRAHQPILDRMVAIKLFSRECAQDPSFCESVAARARAMAQLNHPNLIGIYDFGDLEGSPFIVMEFVEGETLDEAAGSDPIDPPKAVELAIALCRGLAHAHEEGVVHGDIRPSGILLDPSLRPKLGAFGLGHLGATTKPDSPPHLSSYAAPEVAAGDPADQRSDLYAIGAILHRLLTGQAPTRHPLPSAAMLCGSPLVLDAVIAKATDADPNRRFGSVTEFADNLSQATRIVPRSVAPAPRALPLPPVAPSIPVRSPSPSGREVSPGMVVSVIAAIVLLGAAIVWSKQGDGGAAKEEAANQDLVIHAKVDLNKNLGSEKNHRAPRVIEAAAEPIPKALARLHQKLAAGERGEFPEGTVARAGSHYLLCPEPMSWADAEHFAEKHGAHLAVLPSEADRAWFRQEFTFDRPLWLGAGKGAQEQWQWIDGSSWNSEEAVPTGLPTHRRIAFSRSGGLYPARESQAMGLVLQWRDDGSNPGTVAAQLKRAAAPGSSNLSAGRQYPLGTRTRGESNYYPHPVAMRWEDAQKLAASLGAYLAVPSSPEEHQWICQTFAGALDFNQTLWLGGYRLKPGDRWQWLTRESWSNAGWQPNQPARDPALDRLVLQGAPDPNAIGWTAQDGLNAVATGMLLEWSPTPEPVAVARFELKPWLESVNRKLANSVSSDLDDFARERKELVQDYARAMSRIVRKEDDEPEWGRGRDGRGPGPGGFRRPGERREMLEEIEDDLKAVTKSDALLPSLPEGAPKSLRDQQQESETALGLLEEIYDLKLKERLTFYREGIRKKAEDLAEKGYLDTARDMHDLIAPLEDDLTAFLGILFPSSPRATLPWVPRLKEQEPPAQNAPDRDQVFPPRGRPNRDFLEENNS